MKTCSGCKSIKYDFPPDKRSSDGLSCRCRDCCKNSKNSWYSRNKEKVKAFRQDNKNLIRNEQLKYKYGITLEQWNSIFESQKGCCAICNKHQSEFNKTFSVDHCHTTGKIRELLCSKCNQALGLLQESIESCQALIKYIERHK